MTAKSRYEVIQDLEDKKRRLIRERDAFPEAEYRRKKDIKTLERELEDAKDDFKHFQKTVDERKETISELIKSIDDSLKRLSLVKSKSRKK